MTSAFPTVEQAARQEAEFLSQYRGLFFQERIDDAVSGEGGLDREALIAETVAFHHERMNKRPSAAKYPEAQRWVDHVLAVDARVQEMANLAPEQLAIYRSLGAYLMFRGRGAATAPSVEKCRVAYLPDTDHGRLHIKNVDDPSTYWKKRPPMTELPDLPLTWDGTGSGPHIDDEPEEIFPLPVTAMCLTECEDVPGAVAFLTRYKEFWGSANAVLYDRQGRSVAIEKCSRKYIEVFEPNAYGRSHCSGMVCRDPASPQARHQQAMREAYCQRMGFGEDHPDRAFWNACVASEEKLAKLLEMPSPAKVEDIKALFLRPRAQGGLCKDGTLVHPQQSVAEWTLQTRVHYLDERRFERYQRDDGDLSWPALPETYEF